MRKLAALVLILCLLPFCALGETITHDFGDFYLTMPADITGQLNEKVSGGYYFVLYPALDETAPFHPNINCVWQDTYVDISTLFPAQVAQTTIDSLIATMAKDNITVSNAKVESHGFDTVNGKDALVYVISYDIEYPQVNLKTTLYVAQLAVSEEDIKTYTFTFTTDDPTNIAEASGILDSIVWKK